MTTEEISIIRRYYAETVKQLDEAVKRLQALKGKLNYTEVL